VRPEDMQPSKGADLVEQDRAVGDGLGARLVSQEVARCLLSGNVGLKLYFDLATRFPSIRRTEVFFGIALAWTDLQGALVAAEAEISDLRRQLVGRWVT
jgi:hypothetical protein